MPTQAEIVQSALTEIRVARAGDVINPDDMTLGLYLLNRLFDRWNVKRPAIYADEPKDFTFTPALSPHTIGPSGTFIVTYRPIEIQFAAVNLGGSPATYVPITVRDKEWFANQAVPGFSVAVPTDLYYEPAWPNGKLYFCGVPSAAYAVRLWLRTLLLQVAQTDAFSLPQGYQAAVELTLAEELAPAFGQTVADSTAQRARAARADIFSTNEEVPRLDTCDAGMPMAGGSGSIGFNWISRS